MNCLYCQQGEEKRDLLYADEEVVVALPEQALAPGHVLVYPKEHLTIFEVVPEKILLKCASVANKAGMAIFEALGVQGTNVIVRNGLGAGQNVPHFAFEVIPRQENDGLNLLWDPKPLAEDELESTLAILKDESKKKEVKVEKKEAQEIKPESKEAKKEEWKDNPLLSNLRRIP